MNCAEFSRRLPEWLDGTLAEADAREFEQHAALCDACGEQLDRLSHVATPPRELAPPAIVREATLAAVVRQRRRSRWRRMSTGAVAIAAMALILLMSRPARKSASDFPGAGTELLARSRAQPELAALDAAERDVQQALRQQPADTALTGDLMRIRRQREALQRLVAQVRL